VPQSQNGPTGSSLSSSLSSIIIKWNARRHLKLGTINITTTNCGRRRAQWRRPICMAHSSENAVERQSTSPHSFHTQAGFSNLIIYAVAPQMSTEHTNRCRLLLCQRCGVMAAKVMEYINSFASLFMTVLQEGEGIKR